MSTKSNPFSNKRKAFQKSRHAANASQQLLRFHKEQTLFDTTLIAGNDCVKIQAHKIVLTALSEYFFDEFTLESEANEIKLKEIEAPTLKLIIDFMYTGSIALGEQTVEKIVRSAVFLKIKTLIDCCCSYIESHLYSNNSLSRLRLAKEFNLTRLKEKTLNAIYINFEEVWKTPEFLLLNEIELKDLLFKDNPYGDFEEFVFLGLMAWIDHDKTNRKTLQLELMSMVRYQLLTPEFIIDKVPSETEEHFKLIHRWSRWHFSQDTRLKEKVNIVSKGRMGESKLSLLYFLNNELEIYQYTSSWLIKKRIPLPNNINSGSMTVIDKKLILVGGRSLEISIDCLDLQSHKWSNLIHRTKIRNSIQMVNMNGNLCFFGVSDINRDNIASVEIYNFTTYKSQILQPPFPPSKYSKIAAHNEILYMIDFYYGHLQYYNLSTKEWVCKDVKIDELNNFGFAALDQCLYVIGGMKSNDLKTVKRYDLFNETWSDVAPLPKARSFLKCITYKNKIIVYDGDSKKLVEEFNPGTSTWKSLSSIHQSKDLLICILPESI